MAIDLGNNPVGTPPTTEQSQQIKDVLGLGNVEDVALSTWTGSENLSLSSSQVVGFSNAVGTYESVKSVGGKTGVVSLSTSDVEGYQAVNNTNINTAIATDPETIRATIIPDGPLYAADYGIVAGNSADAVAEANATAIATAYAASSSNGRPLVLKGTVYVKGEVLISGTYGTIIGHGCTIIQKDTSHNGLTLAADSGTPPFGLRVFGLKIQGQGSATHAAAGVYGRKSDLSYLTSDIIFRDCIITGFRTGFSLAQIAKFQTDNVSIQNVRVGHDWYLMQTAILLASRIVSGDGDASSTAFNITNGNFATRVIGGEFGGSVGGFKKMASISAGQLLLEGCNLEGFDGQAIINCTGTAAKEVSIIGCRIGLSLTSAQAFISTEVAATGNTLTLHWENTAYAAGGRQVEVWGAAIQRGINLTGSPVRCYYTATQGGIELANRMQVPGHYDWITGALPATSLAKGSGLVLAPHTPSETDGDRWRENLLFKGYNSRTAADQYSSVINDMLCRVIASTGSAVGNTTTTETDLHSVTMPAGTLASQHESLEWEIFGTTAANSNNKTLQFYYGGSSRLTFGPFAANDEDWRLSIRAVKRFSGNSGGVQFVATLSGGAVMGVTTQVLELSYSSSLSAVVTKITGTGTATNDIRLVGSVLKWFRAPSGI